MDDLPEMPGRQGRAARTNPETPYEPLHVDLDPDALDHDELRQIETKYFVDPAQSILSANDSPDVPFTYSINPYRGCEHGCCYCYARPSHEYMDLSAGLDFESRIFVKKKAPDLLADRFQDEKWSPAPICMSGITDPYQPAERELEVTRGLLKVFAHHRNPVSLITKSGLIARDLDLLEEMAEWNGVRVTISMYFRARILGVDKRFQVCWDSGNKTIIWHCVHSCILCLSLLVLWFSLSLLLSLFP
jgi:hypothetical protein